MPIKVLKLLLEFFDVVSEDLPKELAPVQCATCCRPSGGDLKGIE